MFVLIIIALFLFLLWVIGYTVIRPFLKKRIAPRLSQNPLKGNPDTLDFGSGFNFGVSTAAWQIEKDLQPSNWTMFEKMQKPNGTACCPPHGNACEAIERFDGDLEIMKSMYLKRYRFGVSWSALHPDPDRFDADYIKKYIEICRKLRSAGIEPMITLMHFEHPSWLEERGGILSSEFVSQFAKFTRFVVEALKDECKWWFTINEPSVMSQNGYYRGVFPPGHKNTKEYYKAVAQHMASHAAAYHIIHEIIPDAKVSFAENVNPFYPMHEWSIIESAVASYHNNFNTSVLDSLLTGKVEFTFMGFVLFSETIEGLKDSWDFIAINHYFCNWASIDPRDWDRGCPEPLISMKLKTYNSNDFGWSIAPDSMAIVLRWVNDNWNPNKLEMIVSEHGIADASDEKRRWFMVDTLANLKEARDKYNVPLTTYLHWSLLDNYEWAMGYSMKFGLVKVDFENQNRTPRESAKVLGTLAEKSK